MANKRARLRQHQQRQSEPIQVVKHSKYADARAVAEMAAGMKRLRPGSVAYNAVGVSNLAAHSETAPGCVINYANDWRSSV